MILFFPVFLVFEDAKRVRRVSPDLFHEMEAWSPPSPAYFRRDSDAGCDEDLSISSVEASQDQILVRAEEVAGQDDADSFSTASTDSDLSEVFLNWARENANEVELNERFYNVSDSGYGTDVGNIDDFDGDDWAELDMADLLHDNEMDEHELLEMHQLIRQDLNMLQDNVEPEPTDRDDEDGIEEEVIFVPNHAGGHIFMSNAPETRNGCDNDVIAAQNVPEAEDDDDVIFVPNNDENDHDDDVVFVLSIPPPDMEKSIFGAKPENVGDGDVIFVPNDDETDDDDDVIFVPNDPGEEYFILNGRKASPIDFEAPTQTESPGRAINYEELVKDIVGHLAPYQPFTQNPDNILMYNSVMMQLFDPSESF